MSEERREQLSAALQQLRDDPDKLIEIIFQQAERIAELERQIRELSQQIEELRRSGHRSAAPFAISEQKRSKEPKKSGRKPGHGGSFRRAPTPTETIRVELPWCPQCGSAELSDHREHRQIIEEIPAVALRVVDLRTYSAQCAKCGRVRSRHHLQCSTATGAAGVQLGPYACAIAASLVHRWGVTKRKSCQMLKDLFGLEITPGGLVELLHRSARRSASAYDQLWEEARQSDHIHVDETSWYIGSPKACLWVFATSAMTLYRALTTRNRAVITETLGADYPGVLVSDCLSIYDDATAVQHKCYAHHLKAISEARTAEPESAWLEQLAGVLKTAIIVKALHQELPSEQYRELCDGLAQTARRLLELPRGAPAEESVRRRLVKQQDHLFVFLEHEQVQATNNLAERQLRPAVIARKLSCGNRTPKGAHTWEVLASLAATAHQRGQSFLEFISSVLVHPSTLPTR